jgi:hypothetical protein
MISTKSDPDIRAILTHMNNEDLVIQMHVFLIFISLISVGSRLKGKQSHLYILCPGHGFFDPQTALQQLQLLITSLA